MSGNAGLQVRCSEENSASKVASIIRLRHSDTLRQKFQSMGVSTDSLHTETQGISIVETQGILSGENQRTDRVYNFQD